MISGNEDKFVLFSFFAIKPNFCPNFSGLGIDAEVFRLADILVVQLEEVAESKNKAFMHLIPKFHDKAVGRVTTWDTMVFFEWVENPIMLNT